MIAIPHPIAQHHPTRQRRTVASWRIPTTRFTRKEHSRFSKLQLEMRGERAVQLH